MSLARSLWQFKRGNNCIDKVATLSVWILVFGYSPDLVFEKKDNAAQKLRQMTYPISPTFTSKKKAASKSFFIADRNCGLFSVLFVCLSVLQLMSAYFYPDRITPINYKYRAYNGLIVSRSRPIVLTAGLIQWEQTDEQC